MYVLVQIKTLPLNINCLLFEHSDMVVQQVSMGLTSYVILCLVSAWYSPLYDMSVCPFRELATAVIRISNWFLFVNLKSILLYLPHTLCRGMAESINLV